MLSPTFSAFVRRSSSKIDRVMTISKFDLLFVLPDVVISRLTNNMCRPMWRMRLHMWTKFSDDRLQLATFITENVTISFKHECRKPIWRHAATSPVTSTTSKVLFQSNSLHFELLIDVLAQILSEWRQFQNLTYFLPHDLVIWPLT